MNSGEVLKRAANVLRIEADGIASMMGRLDENFARALELLADCSGKVVVTGMGKSGLRRIIKNGFEQQC